MRIDSLLVSSLLLVASSALAQRAENVVLVTIDGLRHQELFGGIDQTILESGERTHYQVNRGDTLWKIARRHNTDVLAVKEINGLRSSRIYEGQVLRLPSAGRR